MTLYRQIFLVLIVLFAVIFAGTMLVNLYGKKLFLAEQLESHAQDTATSLGLSLSPYAKTMDIPAMDTMVSAIFDRGYYQDITVTGSDTKVLVRRTLPVVIEGIPEWFVRRIPLDTPRAGAQVMSDWTPKASVSVQSHPGFAYNELWQTARRMSIWLTGVTIVALILAGLLLRSILKPLAAVEHQAEALYARQYYIQDSIPKTRELKSVVLAMNRMTEKVRNTFEEHARTAEQLREQAFKDSVTELGNRRHFEGLAWSHLRATQEPYDGTLALLRLEGLDEVNREKGYEAGDQYLRAAARVLLAATQDLDHAVVARISGAFFGMLLPGTNAKAAESIAFEICTHLGRLYSDGVAPGEDVAHIGITEYMRGHELAELLAGADAALRAARTLGPNAWSQRSSESVDAVAYGREQWKTRLVQAMHNREFEFFVQPVMAVGDRRKVLHVEILTRIPGPKDTLWRAGEFVSVAEEMGLTRELDRIIVGDVLEHIKTSVSTPAWAINLSPASLRDAGFVSWLVTMISACEQRIVLEFTEFGAVREIDRLLDLANRLRPSGDTVAIDHFGRGFTSFGYLQSLHPEYVKIDRAYTGAIEDSADNRFFVSALSGVAHSLDISTIVEGVEDDDALQALKGLNVDGAQGYAVCRPMSISQWRGTI